MKLTTFTETKQHYTNDNLSAFEKLIENENDYILFMDSIRATRNGLFEITQKRPDLKDSVSNQFQVLNELFNALLPKNGYDYPKY